MTKHHTIRRKITALLLTSVLAALLVNSLFAVWNLSAMKTVFNGQSMALGETAAQNAEKALESMTGEQLYGTAVEKAALIEEKFHTVTSGVRAIAQTAEEIYRNPEAYPDRKIALPVQDSRELAAQLLWSEQLADSPAGEPALPEPTEEQALEIKKLGNLQDLLVQYNAVNDMISSTYLATKSGWMIQADYIAYSKYFGENEIPDYYEAAQRQWFQFAALSGEGETVFSEVIMDVHENRECIVCACPVYVDGELMAVAGIGSYLDTIHEEVLNTTIGESGYAFLLNGNGQVMVSGAEDGETAATPEERDLRDSENLRLAQAAEDMIRGGSGLMRLRLDNREVYLAYAPMGQPEWSFAVVMDVEEVTAPAKESEQAILTLAGSVSKEVDASIKKTFSGFVVTTFLTFLLAGAAGIGLAGRLSRPIRELTREVAETDGGNLDGAIHIHTGDEVEELGNAFNHMRVQLKSYIENMAKATAEKERIHTELQLASRLQSDMLPEGKNPFPEREEFTLYASMTPAKEVGGDFYDFFFTDKNHLAIIVADVSGKGVPAAFFMVVAKTMLRSHITTPETLAKAMEETNDLLCANNKNNMFVTAWAGILDLRDGTLTYVNAGHCRPLIGREKDSYRYRKELGGFVLAGMEGMHYTQTTIRLSPGDTLFQYSDGVTEANDEQGALYGEDRLEAFVNGHGGQEPGELAADLWQDIQSFQGQAEQFDDITMLALRYNGDVRTIRIETPELESVQEVTDFVEEYLQEHGFPAGDTIKMLVAVDEIYSNICRYSGAKKAAVSCLVQGGKAKITFTDNGVPYNPLEKPDPDVTAGAEERPIGGLGIYMVKKTMDVVTYEYEYTEKQNRLCIMKEQRPGT